MDFQQLSAELIQLLEEASESFLAICYFKFLLKCAIYSQNLWFLDLFSKTESYVFPNYMKLKTAKIHETENSQQEQGSKTGFYNITNEIGD